MALQKMQQQLEQALGSSSSEEKTARIQDHLRHVEMLIHQLDSHGQVSPAEELSAVSRIYMQRSSSNETDFTDPLSPMSPAHSAHAHLFDSATTHAAGAGVAHRLLGSTLNRRRLHVPSPAIPSTTSHSQGVDALAMLATSAENAIEALEEQPCKIAKTASSSANTGEGFLDVLAQMASQQPKSSPAVTSATTSAVTAATSSTDTQQTTSTAPVRAPTPASIVRDRAESELTAYIPHKMIVASTDSGVHDMTHVAMITHQSMALLSTRVSQLEQTVQHLWNMYNSHNAHVNAAHGPVGARPVESFRDERFVRAQGPW
jgi:hypothetical protein